MDSRNISYHNILSLSYYLIFFLQKLVKLPIIQSSFFNSEQTVLPKKTLKGKPKQYLHTAINIHEIFNI